MEVFSERQHKHLIEILNGCLLNNYRGGCRLKTLLTKATSAKDVHGSSFCP